jgi:endogenous inhibitor of DNA gyrase (YacG/DUF329 family)
VGAQSVCVSCHRQRVDPVWRPFCSERCKLLDLSRWIDGSYRVAGEPLPQDDTPDAAPAEDKE